jgi:hypothetical protein
VLLRGSISCANTIGDSAGDENLYQEETEADTTADSFGHLSRRHQQFRQRPTSTFGSANIQHIDFQEASQSNRVAALVLFLIVEVDSRDRNQ